MDSRSEVTYIKFNPNNKDHINFLIENLREFYSDKIAQWQYPINTNYSGLYFGIRYKKLIACQGMIPIQINYRNNIIMSAKSETSFLLSDYRGNGYFEQLYEFSMVNLKKDKIDMVWGFTALSKLWKNKLKFEVYDKIIKESEIIISPFLELKLNFLSKYPIKNKVFHAAKLIPLFFRRKTTSAEKLNIVLNEISETNYDIKMSDFYQRWSSLNKNFIFIDYNMNFLKWRIFGNPILNYKIVALTIKNEIVSIAILNFHKDKVYLLDILVLDDSKLDCTIQTIINYIKKKGYPKLIYWATSLNSYANSIHKAFEKKGGRYRYNDNMNFVIRRQLNNNLISEKIEDYYINGLWTEGFKI